MSSFKNRSGVISGIFFNLMLIFLGGINLLYGQMPKPVPFEASNFQELLLELRQLEKEEEFWGAVLIAKGEDILLHEAFGLADIYHSKPNTNNTAFNIASIGKQFTAALILQLAQEGRLDLDDHLAQWVDNLPGNVGKNVTIRHLLRMESGWEDYMNEAEYQENPKKFRRVQDYVKLIRTIEPTFEPGTNTVYSNISYELLGAIIEGETGQPYHKVLEETLFQPVGMNNSGCFVNQMRAGNAVPLTLNYEGKRIASYPLLAYRCSPAGGAYSTTSDLLKFQRYVLDGNLLDKKYTDIFLTRFEKNSTRTPGIFGFIGGVEGANAWVETNLESDVTTVVLSNLDPPSAERVMLGLKNWLKIHL